jgi:hypothetical protein
MSQKNKLNKMYSFLFIVLALLFLLFMIRNNTMIKEKEYFANSPENGKPINEGQSYLAGSSLIKGSELCYEP